MTASIPIVILAGSDDRPAEMPAEAHGRHPLSGYKGADVRFGDRTLVEIVIDRLEACGRFGPIYVAGPSAAYAGVRSRANRHVSALSCRRSMPRASTCQPGSPFERR